MAGPAPVELAADCGTCGLEAGVVEIYDALVAACRFGLPARASCKLCGEAFESTFDATPARPLREIPANRCPGCLAELAPSALDDRRCAACGARAVLTPVRPAARLETEADLVAALEAWAEREGFLSRDALLVATFCTPDIPTLLDALSRARPLEVLADPFAAMGVRTKASPSPRKPSTRPTAPAAPLPLPTPNASPTPTPPATPPATPIATRTSTPTPNAVPAPPPQAPPLPTSPPPPSAPPRAIVYPLVSVVVADGEVHPEERALVDRFLVSEGLAPLTDEELRVHHPSEVAHLVPRERREEVVKLMCESAAVDGLPDESERRVIRAYATAWHVPDEKIEFWMWGYENMSTSLARQLWLKLRRFVLSVRWGAEHEPR